MNLKQILSLAVIAGVSSHAFAMEISHGRIISEKAWSTDGKKVTFAKKSPLARAKEGAPDSQELSVSIESATGKVGEPVTLTGNHKIVIHNETASNQTYFYNISVCVLFDDNTNHCVYQSKHLELSEGGYFAVDAEPELTLAFNAPGSYVTSATTWIRGTATGAQGYLSAASNVTIS